MDIRHPNPEELVELVGRVSAAFQYNREEGSVARDFPLFYNSKNTKHLWAAFAAGKLAAHAGYFPTVMRVENLPVPVAGIGGVYTETEFQGQGTATKLIEKCAEEAKRNGAALAFLWSDKHDFYAKLGFYLTARQWTVTLEPKDIPALRARGEKGGLKGSSLTFFEGGEDPDFQKQSYALLEAYPIGIARSPEEHSAYMGSGSGHVISAWAGKELAAYFVIGKGKDLTACIHEWAGDEAALHFLAAHCLELAGGPLFLFSPQFMPDEVNWIYALNEMGIPMRPEYMSLVKLLDFEKVKRLAHDYLAKAGVPAGDLVLSEGDGKYTVQWKDTTRLEFTEAQLLRFLFGPELPTNQELRKYFPMRLWYWGMDSV
jgi:GNAT superfamily N-acetyltransferase